MVGMDQVRAHGMHGAHEMGRGRRRCRLRQMRILGRLAAPPGHMGAAPPEIAAVAVLAATPTPITHLFRRLR